MLESSKFIFKSCLTLDELLKDLIKVESRLGKNALAQMCLNTLQEIVDKQTIIEKIAPKLCLDPNIAKTEIKTILDAVGLNDMDDPLYVEKHNNRISKAYDLICKDKGLWPADSLATTEDIKLCNGSINDVDDETLKNTNNVNESQTVLKNEVKSEDIKKKIKKNTKSKSKNKKTS